MKQERQNKILEIIRIKKVSTQEELQVLLAEAGFQTTQATISRDIRDLRLVKAPVPGGASYYIQPSDQNTSAMVANSSSIFIESIKKVDYAGNIVVVQCYTGMANAVCMTIDGIGYHGIIGSIAGDDTIFLLVRTEQDAQELCDYLNHHYRH